jgi:hypothetical protein
VKVQTEVAEMVKQRSNIEVVFKIVGQVVVH